jgi:predicted transcriptional regulator
MKNNLFWTGLIMGSLIGYTATSFQKYFTGENNSKLNSSSEYEKQIDKMNMNLNKQDSNDFSKRINNLEKTLQKINREEL